MPERSGAQKRREQTPIQRIVEGPEEGSLEILGVNKLINAYLEWIGEYLKVYLPLAVIALLLLAVMLFAAYQFLKG